MRKWIFTVIKGVALWSWITIVLLIVWTISYYFYELYGDDVGHFVHDYSTTAFKNIPLSNSCKRTWWHWGNATYSAGCASNTPPKTKQERVNREEFQWHGGNCTMSLVGTVACICKSWYYYWSDEEGCISKWNIIQSKVLESLE